MFINPVSVNCNRSVLKYRTQESNSDLVSFGLFGRPKTPVAAKVVAASTEVKPGLFGLGRRRAERLAAKAATEQKKADMAGVAAMVDQKLHVDASGLGVGLTDDALEAGGQEARALDDAVKQIELPHPVRVVIQEPAIKSVDKPTFRVTLVGKDDDGQTVHVVKQLTEQDFHLSEADLRAALPESLRKLSLQQLQTQNPQDFKRAQAKILLQRAISAPTATV